MTVIGGMELGRELGQLVSQINQCIEAEKDMANNMGVDPWKLRDSNGNLAMAPLLAAKAQTLHALVLVNQRRS